MVVESSRSEWEGLGLVSLRQASFSGAQSMGIGRKSTVWDWWLVGLFIGYRLASDLVQLFTHIFGYVRESEEKFNYYSCCVSHCRMYLIDTCIGDLKDLQRL